MTSKCKNCGETKSSYQMKTSTLCNICAFEKSQKRSYAKTKKKFRSAKKFKTGRETYSFADKQKSSGSFNSKLVKGGEENE